MPEKMIKSFRDIPAVEKLASDPILVKSASDIPRPLLIEIIRSVIDQLKKRQGHKFKEISLANLFKSIEHDIDLYRKKKIGKVINGTGILVHTNLGRAPLSETLFEKIKDQVTGYGNLEFETAAGKRGRRGELAEKYLALISQAEAGAIVNNNAAALFLILNTLANRRQVVISRGELVQIGGGFRIPDIIKKSGARLLEIGTTNITSLSDYRSALDKKPAVILKVHRSNFALSGFTDDTDLADLVKLGQENGIPVINDLGSGGFVDTREFAGEHEPTVQESVRSGADLTCFSGDKLLGGMQAGLIVGRSDLIDKIKRNPVFRTMRVDKVTFSALEELLGYYLDGSWKDNIKLWNLATSTEAKLYEKGSRLIETLRAGEKIILEASQGKIGGGALPEIPLPSVCMVFRSTMSPQKIAALFRDCNPPVIGRINNDRFGIDLKAIDDNDLKPLTRILKTALKKL
jgi:L-seryl-tRNA(Ser) seleniumtransferase